MPEQDSRSIPYIPYVPAPESGRLQPIHIPREIWSLIFENTLRSQAVIIHNEMVTTPYDEYRSTDGQLSYSVEGDDPQEPPEGFIYHHTGSTVEQKCVTPQNVSWVRIAKILSKDSNKAADHHRRIFPDVVNANRSKSGGLWYGEQDIIVFRHLSTLQAVLDPYFEIKLTSEKRHRKEDDLGNPWDFEGNQTRINSLIESNRGIRSLAVMGPPMYQGVLGNIMSLACYDYLCTFPDLTLLIFRFDPDPNELSNDPEQAKQQIRESKTEFLEISKARLEAAVHSTGYGFGSEPVIEVFTSEEFQNMLDDWDEPSHPVDRIELNTPGPYDSSGDEDSEDSQPEHPGDDPEVRMERLRKRLRSRRRNYTKRKQQLKEIIHDKDEEIGDLREQLSTMVLNITEKFEEQTATLKGRYEDIGRKLQEQRGER